MGDSRTPGPIGTKSLECSITDGTSARRQSPEPGSTGLPKNSAATKDVLRRIKDWRNFADFTGLYPDAVRALDHYLDRTGTYVVIPPGKVKSVRADAEGTHWKKSKAAFKTAAIMEAGAAWLEASGFPENGGQLKPKQVEFMLTYESGTTSRGATNDNLTYFGSSIHSEVRFSAEQMTVPVDPDEENFTIKISVVEWRSWVVDNYDWEGDKSFGIFPMLGLPTQKEMNSLQKAGLAKSYQRSSPSWIVQVHGLAAWNEVPYSVKTLKEVSAERQKTKNRRELDREKERKQGALPTPRPAEEMAHCFQKNSD